MLYGDLTCPRCLLALERLQVPDVRLVWRHLVLSARGPRPRALARALEAAAAQGAFWPFLDGLRARPGRTEDPDLWALAADLGLDVARFEADRRGARADAVVDAHLDEALRAGAVATPTIEARGERLHDAPSAAWVAALGGVASP